ncbi:CHS5 (YLR330W) [Zygosaccharomyces parabailii]|nr:CHS5 (YLR330W) [Zygosaccharomyces parabailii]CDH12736.1 uncharacterized protein ZBAI_04522 [Zygosaccharomyces bailii ISA1307]
MSDVEVLLTVGKLDASLALLTTQDHHVIEFPTMLLPDNVKAGSIVKLSVCQNLEEEKRQRKFFWETQMKILEKYGTDKPKAPVLKIVNVTQTSCVLAWDPLDLGSARLKSLILYRQGVRSMVIPSPLKTLTTKISGLSVDTDYEFQLKLSTTSGQYWSEKVKMHTHKMTDMSGITVCLGPLDPLQNVTGEQIAQSLLKIGARSMQKHAAIDTTHFVTNDVDNENDPELARAKNSNIPIVRPEWVRACETERRIVGVRGFYLDADPSILKDYQFPKASSVKAEEKDVSESNLPEPPTTEGVPDTKQHEGETLESTKEDTPEQMNDFDVKESELATHPQDEVSKSTAEQKQALETKENDLETKQDAQNVAYNKEEEQATEATEEVAEEKDQNEASPNEKQGQESEQKSDIPEAVEDKKRSPETERQELVTEVNGEVAEAREDHNDVANDVKQEQDFETKDKLPVTVDNQKSAADSEEGVSELVNDQEGLKETNGEVPGAIGQTKEALNAQEQDIVEEQDPEIPLKEEEEHKPVQAPDESSKSLTESQEIQKPKSEETDEAGLPEVPEVAHVTETPGEEVVHDEPGTVERAETKQTLELPEGNTDSKPESETLEQTKESNDDNVSLVHKESQASILTIAEKTEETAQSNTEEPENPGIEKELPKIPDLNGQSSTTIENELEPTKTTETAEIKSSDAPDTPKLKTESEETTELTEETPEKAESIEPTAEKVENQEPNGESEEKAATPTPTPSSGSGKKNKNKNKKKNKKK